MTSVLDRPAALVRRASLEARALRAMVKAGALGGGSWEATRGGLKAMREYGPFSALPVVVALKHPDRTAIVDDGGTITFAALEESVTRLANAWRAQGMGPGTTLGILCRNHRAPLIAAFAASRLGMTSVWLNTSFSKAQATEVAGREGVELLLVDAELEPVVADVAAPKGRLVCGSSFEDLVASGATTAVPGPDQPGRLVLLTSGTTGTPKGAPRAEPKSLLISGALLDRLPMRTGDPCVVAPPLFHGTGLTLAGITLSLGSTLILRRRFDARQLLDDLVEHRATGAILVPIMLQRLLALPEEEIRARDLSRLEMLFCAGSQLPAEVATRATEVFGDVIHNLYGSTECAIATIAVPADVRAAPKSVGKPVLGAQVRIIGDDRRDVAPGATGRIFVGSVTPFEGYTGGGNKDIIDGLLATGDVGHFDAAGRLYIDGRDDDMIVSGGENVFPREVEELLITHPDVADVAAIGVDDPEWGQRLAAFVVRAPGAVVSGEELQAFVKDNLARYKVPRDVTFLDELPRNPTGKVLRRELVSAVVA